jgi:hypothetical protein
MKWAFSRLVGDWLYLVMPDSWHEWICVRLFPESWFDQAD